jgi:hypothetical protein
MKTKLEDLKRLYILTSWVLCTPSLLYAELHALRRTNPFKLIYDDFTSIISEEQLETSRAFSLLDLSRDRYKKIIYDELPKLTQIEFTFQEKIGLFWIHHSSWKGLIDT